MNEEILKDLRGRTKASILLGFLPMNASQKVVSYLDNLEKEILIKEITNMQKFDVKIIEAILKEYISYIKGNNYGVIKNGAEYAMKLLEGAVPKNELEEMMGRIYSNNARPLDSLKKIRDVGPLFTFLQSEDPQTIAVIVSHMKPSQGAELLQNLPEEKMVKVSIAIANMDQTNKDVLARIEKHLNKKLETFITDESNETDGIKTLVNILNNVSRSTEKNLFERLDKMNAELSKIVKDNMFVFEDIVKLNNISLQKVVNEVTDNELIALALRGASEEMKERFFKAMPDGRKALVKDADEGLIQVRKTDSEEAQQKIANIVKMLEKKKEIIVQRGEEDVII